jgi:hypothetical protein
MNRRLVSSGLLVLAVTLLACGSDEGTPRGIAERFIDAHYVRIDLPAARPYTSGLARKKIDEEKRLIDGQEIDEATRVPRIHYELLEERVQGDDVVSFAYDATVRMDGAEPFNRTLHITVRRDGADWKVTNYDEH